MLLNCPPVQQHPLELGGAGAVGGGGGGAPGGGGGGLDDGHGQLPHAPSGLQDGVPLCARSPRQQTFKIKQQSKSVTGKSLKFVGFLVVEQLICSQTTTEIT